MKDSTRPSEAWLASAPGACECLVSDLECDLVLLARPAESELRTLWASDPARLSELPADELRQVVQQVKDGKSPVCLPNWPGVGSLLAVPLLGLPDDSDVSLIVHWQECRALVNQDVRFAANIAALLSVAGQGAWLRQKLFQPVQEDEAGRSRRSRERSTCLETLNFVSESAREGRQFNEIAAETMNRLAAGLETEFGALYFGLDGAWILVAHIGFDDRFPMAASFLPAHLLAWTTLADPVCDFEIGEPLTGLFTEAGVASWINLPMLEEGQVKGGMLLASREVGRFSPELAEMLARISRQLQASMLQTRLSRDLSEQAADLRAVLGSLSDALIEVTADRFVLQANAAAVELLGVSVGSRRAEDWQTLVPLFDLHRDEPAGEVHPIAKTFIHAVPQKAAPWRLIRGDRTLYVSVAAAPIMDEKQARVRAAVLVLRDISEMRAAEQKLLSAEKKASLTSLAAGVAHEFKNYLSGILGNASLALQASSQPAVVNTAMQRILDIAARANQTALSLHSFVGDSREAPEVLELGHLLREVTCLFEQRALQQNVHIVSDIALGVYVNGLASRLRQVVLNLLENAIEAMPEGGQLNIVLSGDEFHARLSIRDSGMGIAPENMSRVFDPFFSTKGVWGGESGAGNGLGLTTSANYVREMGGDIEIRSTVGQGTDVRIVLLRVERSQAAITASAHMPRTTWILESDESARERLGRVLAQETWQVTIVSDAQDLMAQLERSQPTLAFVDATMPGKLNFIRALEALQSGAPECQIVVTTGTATDYQLAEYIQSAAARLVKPITDEQVREFLARRDQATLPA